MAETRTTSSTGGQKGTKLARFDLIPIDPLTELAEHYGIGASKYANHQWRRGYEWSKSYAALSRHLTAFWAGFDYDACSNDPEGCSHVDTEGRPFVAIREDACFNHTGSHHMAAVAWHAFCLLEFKDRFPQHDDRYRPAEPEEDNRITLTGGLELADVSGPGKIVIEPGGIFIAPIDGDDGPTFTDLGFGPASADLVWVKPGEPDPFAWPEESADVLRKGLLGSSETISFTMENVPAETLRLMMGVQPYYDPEDDVRAVRQWFHEQMAELIRLTPSTNPGTELTHPYGFDDVERFLPSYVEESDDDTNLRYVAPVHPEDVDLREARFVAGPHGTEDRDEDAMSVSYGPDMLSKRAPITEMGLGGEVPVLHEEKRPYVTQIVFHDESAPNRNQIGIELQRSMERRRHPGSGW